MTPGPHSLRALVLAPAGRDAKVASDLLASAGLATYICDDLNAFQQQIAAGAGLALVVEEALLNGDLRLLKQWVIDQPSWSDFPFIVLSLRSGASTYPALGGISDALGNVTFVERPFRPSSLVSLVQSAVRGRRRQYEARARIEELRESHDHLALETHALEVLNRTSREIAADFDLDTIVQKVVDRGADLTGAKFGAFFYSGEGTPEESHRPLVLTGASRDAFASFPLPDDNDVLAPSIIGPGVFCSADISQDQRFRRGIVNDGTHHIALVVRSYLAVPVVSHGGGVIGGLFFGHPDAGRFDGRSESLGVGLAAQAAVAIDNARLVQGIQKANATLETRIEERTRERDRMWRLSGDLMDVRDTEGHMLAVNRAWTSLLGWTEEELLAVNFFDLVHADDIAATKAELAEPNSGAGTLRFENRFRAKDGSYRRISWTASPEDERFYSVGRDITEQREMEEQLKQSQKMEAIGQLTGGIAHDFNNILQGITGSLDLVIRRKSQGREADVERFISAAMTSANRAAALTHRLLAFSRRQPLDPKPIKANSLVGSMEDLLRRTLGERIKLDLVLAGGLWRTLCDANQLENAILNLCINARDAMPNGGRLTVETANTHLDRSYAASSRDVRPGQYVCINVTDTGAGMSSDTMRRAFDPFFTTKPFGHGTGLGLSMIYGFARQSGGHAKIQSELHRGTTVSLYLPRFRGAEEAEESAPMPVAGGHANQGETILVVEDEPVVRRLIVELLFELGYRALEAIDGPSGLAFLRSKTRIDLLITDIGLPGLNGRQIAEVARAERPDLKVLFMTGYAENATLASGFLEPGMEMITKPFPMDALAQRLTKLMGGWGSFQGGTA